MTEQKLVRLITAYFENAFTVTFVLSLFKLVGITSNNWLWTTFFLWAPLAALIGCIGIASVLFYVGFALGSLGQFLKKIFLM